VVNMLPMGKGVGVHGCMFGWVLSWSVLTVPIYDFIIK
jgi:hypothetical protein